MNPDFIRIGTRGSALALWQAQLIAGLLNQGGIHTRIVPIETKGDKILDTSLAKIGSKGVFTAELEDALRSHEIDIAVHSAKDLPSHLPDDLELIAFTEREQVNDVLISFNPDVSLTDNHPWVVGTSSTRRTALLRHFYPHIRTVDMRGNLQTRLKKLRENHCDALLLAYAGVHRMRYDEHIVAHLSIHEFTPPVGQGSVAVEAARQLSPEKRHLIRQLCNHSVTETGLLAERAYLARLQGGCSIPVFALATVLEDALKIRGGIVSLDGQTLIERELTGPHPEATKLGTQLAEAVLHAGGGEILRQIRQTLRQD